MLSPGDLAEIRQKLGREPTDVEAACFENLWSEHCSYRSTRRHLATLPTTGPGVLLGPGDDAAIVSFSADCALAIGMESHNHPSYVDPHDGAATGVGGIVRDVLSMGARPIALMDPLYFGDLRKEKNRYLMENVVAGIGGYGNCIGVPVVRGELAFDDSYDGNPLVNVVCIGMVDPGKYLTARVKRPGNRLVLVGASTGRDGLGGASFASRDLSEDSEAADRPSVQIGDPFTEKLLIEAVLAMAATGRVWSCRDLGAAGLAGASSEMCSSFGGHIQADRVHLREEGMHPVEIMLAESQERMLLEVAPEDVDEIGRIASAHDLRWSDIGEVITEPYYRVTFGDKTVCNLPIDLLISGAPRGEWREEPVGRDLRFRPPGGDLRDLCLSVLSHPEIGDSDWVVRQYDHDVQIRTVRLGPDAAVLRLDGAGLALSCGCNPRHVGLGPYEGTANAVAENAANLACVGAVPLCIVNCLNFASPVHPGVAWELAESVRGMGDMARQLGTPVVGGNVSLYNESDEHGTRILPTPSIGIVGRTRRLSWYRPGPGDGLAVAGQTGDHLGGSLLDTRTRCGGMAPPIADISQVALVRDRIASGAEIYATDLSRGGLLAALARSLPGARVSLEGDPLAALFSETYGRFLVAFRRESDLAGLDYSVIGEVCGEGLRITTGSGEISLTAGEVRQAAGSLSGLMGGRT